MYCILKCPKNDTTNFINEYVINQIPGERKTLLSADSVPNDQAALYPTAFLNSITPSGLPPHRLYLKIHVSVILWRGLDPTGALCNGTRLTIGTLLNRIIDAEIATGVHKGKCFFIPRIPMTPTDTDFPFASEEAVSHSSCILYNNQQRPRTEYGECGYISTIPWGNL